MGIALGICVMILTLAIVAGFQNEIRSKVIGFGSHIQITNFDNNESFEGTPLESNQPFLAELKKKSSPPAINSKKKWRAGIRHIQSFATKAGIIKTKNELQGVVVKGVGSDFDWDFFKKNIIAGKHFTVSDTGKTNQILISKYHAEKLNLKLNDTIAIFFVQNRQQRARKFSVCGIYSTGMGELFDQIFVLADIAHIQKLNGWTQNQMAGFEILLNDYKDIDAVTAEVNEIIGYEFAAKSIKELNRQIFSWLDAQDVNAVVIITLMILVAAINMISALLILILERTNMIGTLKSLGMTNAGVRKIFLYNASHILLRGMLWGNAAGIILCLLQQYFHLLPLDERTYYVSFIPVQINILPLLLLNTGTFAICVVMLVLPSYIITSITPVKAMKFA